MKNISQHAFIKKIPRRREDFLTIFEKTWRDWLLFPITYVLFRLRLTPNIVTIVGGILLIVAIVGDLQNLLSQETTFIILLIAIITDMIDGSFARNHDMVTPLGVWLDHIRDYAWVVWVSYIIYTQNLVPFETLGVLFGLNILYLFVILRDLLINFLRTPKGKNLGKAYLRDYTMRNLQADIFGRVHFTTWGIGYLFYLLYLISHSPILWEIGNVLMTITIIFGAIQLYGAYQRTFDIAPN